MHVLAKSGKNYINECQRCAIEDQLDEEDREKEQKLFAHTNDKTNDTSKNRHSDEQLDLNESKEQLYHSMKEYSEQENTNSLLSFNYDVKPPTPIHMKKDVLRNRKRNLTKEDQARITIAFMLVDAGVDINGLNSEKLRPLHYAAKRGVFFFIFVDFQNIFLM